MKEYLKLIRVKHYVKNILIFLPLFFGGRITDAEMLLRTTAAFLIFCVGSSVVYIINDIKDIGKDRVHPTKCKRSLASGAVGVKSAVVLAISFSAVVIAASVVLVMLGLYPLEASLWLLGYILINLLYSAWLKNIPVIDILVLASGFVLRLYYGSCVSGVEVSSLLYLTVLGGAFYLGMGKRRNELLRSDGETRAVLKKYSYEFLDKNMHVCIAFTEVMYALWALQVPNKYMVWSVPIVMVILMKYSLIVEQKDSEADPVNVILGDKVMLLLCALYAATAVFGVYFAKG